MKNGKKPTLIQKKEMKLHGLQPENWLVVKDTREFLEVVSRMELKRIGTGKKRTRRLYRSEKDGRCKDKGAWKDCQEASD